MPGEHHVDYGVMAVYCGVEIAPATANLQMSVIDVPGLASSIGPATTPLSQPTSQYGREFRLPHVEGLVAKTAPRLKHILLRSCNMGRSCNGPSTTRAMALLRYWVQSPVVAIRLGTYRSRLVWRAT